VTYEVGGTTRGAEITYQNVSGGTEQKGVRVPWRMSMSADYGDFLYISAQNFYDEGTIECRIRVNAKVIQEARSAGAYVIATCSGNAGY
jgi:hypothetical protein